MNWEVYAYLLRTYGRRPLIWLSCATELFRLSISRVYFIIILAQITANLASGDFAAAKWNTVYLAIVYVVGMSVGTIGELILSYDAQKEYNRLGIDFYRRISGKDLAFFRDNQTGYLASVFQHHLDSAIRLVRFVRAEVLGTFVTTVVPPIVLFFSSPKIGLMAIAVIVVQFMYIVWASSKVNKYRKYSFEFYKKMIGEISDVITNMIAFKSAGADEKAHDKMAGLIKDATDAFEKRSRTIALLDFPRNIITALGITGAIYLAVSNASDLSPESLGLLVLTVTYMIQIVRNVGHMPDVITRHDDLVLQLHPTLQYLKDDYENIRDPEHPKELQATEGEILIKNVTFGYPSHSDRNTKISVFNDLTIQIQSGEKVGIVGLSGAGKSTLASLLLRFDDVGSGSIQIDGIDIKDVKQSDLRRNIAYVPQEPLLFHRTVRENIAYYNAGSNEEDIVRAAKAAHAHEFIEKLPQGYDTMVGERGIKLSGGQKQRIAIARAILKKAPIMIFDEATSALDSESEQIIQKALPEILGKQTAIVVAHRLSTVAGLDRIIVMHDGKIEESGTHHELLAQRGRYYSLWQKQTAEFGTQAARSMVSNASSSAS